VVVMLPLDEKYILVQVIMRNQKQLIVKNNIQEIKRVCEQKGINYEITSSNSVKQIYQEEKSTKLKITDQQLKEDYQKLAKNKNYEKEMQL
ncbi:8411_t:CDS:1, partial [Ambispora gerdemannii]